MLLLRQNSSTSFPPSFLDFSSSEPDFSSLSDYSDLPEDTLMSGQSYSHNFQDPGDSYWAAQTPPYGQDNLFAANPYGAPDYRQQSTSGPREWNPYGDGSFQAAATTVSPQPKLAQHRRALSNSTVASYASTSSPRQYAAGVYDGSTGYLDPSYGAYQQTHHYPTPSQTPTQDSFADQGNGRQGRPGANMERMSTAQRAMKNAGATEQTQANSPSNQGAQHYSNEYLATPKTTNGDYGEGQAATSGPSYGETSLEYSYDWTQNDSFHQPLAMRHIPDLNRTMSDIYQDSLYNPSSTIPLPAQPQQVSHSSMLSPHSVINRRLQAANDTRTSRSPGESHREPSPYSPHSPYDSAQAYGPVQGGGVGSAAAQRQMRKAEADAQAYRQHHTHQEDVAPKTISPQEAYLDHFHGPVDNNASATPLFPGEPAPHQRYFDPNQNQAGYGPLPDDRRIPSTSFSFHNPTIPVASHPQPPNGGFKFEQLQHHMSGDSNDEPPTDFPAHLVSMETSKSEPEQESSQENDAERPAGRLGDGGTYTCTYQNCTRRFATPAQLQKHKREGHRSTGANSVRGETDSPNDRSSASPPRDTQAGPHRCDRINPSTGKPCNTIFSRPYDLTRHEDTIHARRGKVQCQYCNEEKTFSRADALTRHMRVVHPTIEFPGKHRRRNVD